MLYQLSYSTYISKSYAKNTHIIANLRTPKALFFVTRRRFFAYTPQIYQ